MIDPALVVLVASMRGYVRTRIGRLYAALLAAGHDDRAERVAGLLLDAQDNEKARFELIERALDAGQPRPIHREWLDQAAEKGATNDGLRGRLKTALASHP